MSVPEDDPTAAEYVLGTLDAEERSAAAARLQRDTAFAAKVSWWEARLAPLNDRIPEASPPPQVLDALLRRLFGASGAVVEPVAVLALYRSLRRWRVATGVVGALAAALLAWIAVHPPASAGGHFVAVLQKDANAPAMILTVDAATRTLTIRPVSTEEPADKSLELWLINPEVGGPRSLGTLSDKTPTEASLRSYDSAVIARATYAVTVEPRGGSPTGAPSSTPILVGKLVSTAP